MVGHMGAYVQKQRSRANLEQASARFLQPWPWREQSFAVQTMRRRRGRLASFSSNAFMSSGSNTYVAAPSTSGSARMDGCERARARV